MTPDAVAAAVDEGDADRVADLLAEAAARPASRAWAGAFRCGAEFFRARGAHRPAAAQGVREVAVWRALDDVEGLVSALSSLAVTYLAQGRPHRAIGCADEVLELRLLDDDAPKVAEALGRLGALMVEVGRLDSAAGYFARADEVVARLPFSRPRSGSPRPG